MKSLQTFVGIIIFIAILYSCAKISSPDGGPKDETPPIFINSSPENYSTFFNKNEIKIFFDEFIILNDPQKQIIFSPPISPKPEIYPLSVPSKNIKIKLPYDSLQKNTTYTINFGQSIEDNNEGNTLSFFKYVFSTGDYIDSLQLNGTINDMNNRETPEFSSIFLYENNDTYSDSIVFQKPPNYIAYAQDSTNVFILENMKAGKYKLIAIEDINGDYKFTPGLEKIGFVEEFVELPTDKSYSLDLFDTTKDFRPTRPKQVGNNHLIFGYEGVLDSVNYSINLLTKSPKEYTYTVTKRDDSDTLDYWYKPYFKTDSLLFAFVHQGKKDTLVVKNKELKKDSLQITIKPKSTIEYNEKIYLKANLPLVKIDDTKINLVDNDSVDVRFEVQLDTFQNHVKIDFTKKEKTKYLFQILPGAVYDFFGNTNDSIQLKVQTKPRINYSLFDLTITNLDRFPAIVQLVDEKEKIEASVVFDNKNRHVFEYVNPGTYYIKVIYDDNTNGVWDSGDFLKKIQPEEVNYYQKPIKFRANWDDIRTISLP